MTCVITEPQGGCRSSLDWASNDEKTSNDFQQFNCAEENFAHEALELADALEKYKLIHRRRYISFEEILCILHTLGYRRS